MGSGWWCDSFRTHSHPTLTVPLLRCGICVILAVLTVLPNISAGRKGVWQPSRLWGTQVFPFWKVSRCLPPGLKRGEYPGVTATSVSCCCFPTCVPLPTPEWSRASAMIILSCSAMCRGQRPPGKTMKCFVHSFRLIRKIEHESSSPVSPLEDLPK